MFHTNINNFSPFCFGWPTARTDHVAKAKKEIYGKRLPNVAEAALLEVIQLTWLVGSHRVCRTSHCL